MRVLLDTHAIIWHFEDSKSLSPSAKAFINDSRNRLFISAVSIWELTIKASRGKLKLSSPIHEIIGGYTKRGTTLLPITPEHALSTESLPWLHRDPFDRMLIAQAKQESLILLTQDAAIHQYDVQHIG